MSYTALWSFSLLCLLSSWSSLGFLFIGLPHWLMTWISSLSHTRLTAAWPPQLLCCLLGSNLAFQNISAFGILNLVLCLFSFLLCVIPTLWLYREQYSCFDFSLISCFHFVPTHLWSTDRLLCHCWLMGSLAMEETCSLDQSRNWISFLHPDHRKQLYDLVDF